MRVALGIAYRGSAYSGWQSQPSGRTVQDHVEAALAAFAAVPVSTICAGRTDAGVHAINQVVHFDTDVERSLDGWTRGTNRYLPADVAVQWSRFVDDRFHSRASARGRRYAYVLLESPVRPAIENGMAGWTFRSLDGDAMRRAAAALVGTHDFSAFRAAECQARSPVRTVHALEVVRRGDWLSISITANAFLQHMVRNIVGTLLAVGRGEAGTERAREQLESRQRSTGEATAAAHGLYFWNVEYPPQFGLPDDSGMIDFYPLY